MLLLKNAKIITVSNGVLEKGSVLIQDGKIAAVDTEIAQPSDCEVIDLAGQWLMPGLIDPHTHVSVYNDPATMPGNDNDANEMTDPITPFIRAADALNPFDLAIPKIRSCGFTTLYTGPGSANLIGGSGIAFKLRGETAEEMIIQGTDQMKMALGENPKRCYGLDGKKAPMTRMANAAMIREALLRAKDYAAELLQAEQNGGKKPSFDPKSEGLRKVISGEQKVRIHCHRADDICTAIRLVEEFNLDYSLEHVTEGYKIIRHLQAKRPQVVIGPLLMTAMKKEIWYTRQDTPAKLAEAGLEVSLTADSMADTMWLPTQVGIAMRFGLSEEDAFRSVTINPARILGLEDRLGSIEVGKDADLAVFDGHPFHNLSHCILTIIEGERYYPEF